MWKRCKLDAVFILIIIFFCEIIVFRLGLFGSKIDWLSQHSVFPDYFRQLFYETGNLFPDFATNLGGGQNIYNFSYYGLYSPVILFSYLLPFVKMGDYIMVVSMISLMASVLLFNRWISGKILEEEISFAITMMFFLATPIIFHSYVQIMFVNYMPFLMFAFIGMDRFLEQGKWRGLLLGVFLMIMTSFYFSVGGMLSLGLYGVYRYLQLEEQFNARNMLFQGMKVAGIFFTAICCSGILLVPTTFALINGRSVEHQNMEFLDLILPEIYLERFLLSPYGIGLTSLLLTSLFSYIIRKRSIQKLLGCTVLFLLCSPLIIYLLNGGLYGRGKVFIPFLPILCYLIAEYLCYLRKQEYETKEIVPYIATIATVCLYRKQTDYWAFMLADAILMLCVFLLLRKKRKKLSRVLYATTLGILILAGIVINHTQDYMLDEEYYEATNDKAWKTAIETILKEDDETYRIEQYGDAGKNMENINRIHTMRQWSSSLYSSVYNTEYVRFRNERYYVERSLRNNLMCPTSANPLFLRFMGVKYLVTDETQKKIYDYEAIETVDGKKIWKNEKVAPIGYITNQTLDEKVYCKYDYPYNQLALTEYAVVDDSGKKNGDISANVQAISINDFPVYNKGRQKIKLPYKAKKGEILFLQFEVENRDLSKDVKIKINGQTNKLTAYTNEYYNNNTVFHYTIGLNEGEQFISIQSTKGTYRIKNIKAYTAIISEEKSKKLYKNAVQFSTEQTKGNEIVIDFKATKESYFVSSIPYDENFTLWMDGEEIPYERINTAFLGCKVKPGSHHLRIVYKAPGSIAGKILSVIGGILVLLLGVTVSSQAEESDSVQILSSDEAYETVLNGEIHTVYYEETEDEEDDMCQDFVMYIDGDTVLSVDGAEKNSYGYDVRLLSVAENRTLIYVADVTDNECDNFISIYDYRDGKLELLTDLTEESVSSFYDEEMSDGTDKTLTAWARSGKVVSAEEGTLTTYWLESTEVTGIIVEEVIYNVNIDEDNGKIEIVQAPYPCRVSECSSVDTFENYFNEETTWTAKRSFKVYKEDGNGVAFQVKKGDKVTLKTIWIEEENSGQSRYLSLEKDGKTGRIEIPLEYTEDSLLFKEAYVAG